MNEDDPRIEQPREVDAHESSDAADAPAMTWTDASGLSWDVSLSPDSIRLTSADRMIELPERQWARDIHVAQHDSRYVVRVETFDDSVGFLLDGSQAAPLLELLTKKAPAAAAAETHDAPEPQLVQPLLWPRVSPLAIWALICSSLVFIPVFGLLPAIGAAVLLLLHRKRVRRTRAYSHSRKLCVVATIFLAAGLLVSGLSTWSCVVAQGTSRSLPGPAMPEFRSIERQEPAESRLIAQSFLDREYDWPMIVAAFLVVLLSLSVHEAAHAITAWWLGDDFARRLGRVTLKPTAHIDPFGTIVLPLILLVMNGPVFGYAKPVPVRMENLPRWRRAHILVSIAGPGSNLLLAAASMLLMLGLACVFTLWVPEAQFSSLSLLTFRSKVEAAGFPLADAVAALFTVLKLSVVVNIILAFFNMIPIPPLDGSWVLEHLFPWTLGRLYARIRPMGFLIFLLVIYSGAFRYLMYPAIYAILGPDLLIQMCIGGR